MRHLAAALGAVGVLTFGGAGAAQAGYVFHDIVDPLNPAFTQALGINDSGVVGGYGNATAFNGFTVKPPGGFVRQNFGGFATQVVGINNAGSTVGFYVDNFNVTHGFSQTGGILTPFDRPGTAFTQLLGVNNTGTVVGYSSLDPAGMTMQLAFALSGGHDIDLNALLPSNINSQATGVNDAGKVVGFYQLASGAFDGFLENRGVVTTVVVPGATSTQALGINNKGEIVGDFTDAGGVMHGFVDNGGLFTAVDPANSTATTINGVNNLGQIVGFFTDAGGNTIGFEANPVPEPATLLVLGAGLVGLAAAHRKRPAAA